MRAVTSTFIAFALTGSVLAQQPAFKRTVLQQGDISTAGHEVDRVPYYPQGIARQLVGILASPPRHEMLKNVKCPALVIHGETDPLVDIAGGRDTAASIPGARLVTIPGMGHDFTSKLVPVYLREIGDFVSEVEARRKAA